MAALPTLSSAHGSKTLIQPQERHRADSQPAAYGTTAASTRAAPTTRIGPGAGRRKCRQPGRWQRSPGSDGSALESAPDDGTEDIGPRRRVAEVAALTDRRVLAHTPADLR